MYRCDISVKHISSLIFKNVNRGFFMAAIEDKKTSPYWGEVKLAKDGGDLQWRFHVSFIHNESERPDRNVRLALRSSDRLVSAAVHSPPSLRLKIGRRIIRIWCSNKGGTKPSRCIKGATFAVDDEIDLDSSSCHLSLVRFKILPSILFSDNFALNVFFLKFFFHIWVTVFMCAWVT